MNEVSSQEIDEAFNEWMDKIEREGGEMLLEKGKIVKQWGEILILNDNDTLVAGKILNYMYAHLFLHSAELLESLKSLVLVGERGTDVGEELLNAKKIIEEAEQFNERGTFYISDERFEIFK